MSKCCLNQVIWSKVVMFVKKNVSRFGENISNKFNVIKIWKMIGLIYNIYRHDVVKRLYWYKKTNRDDII